METRVLDGSGLSQQDNVESNNGVWNRAGTQKKIVVVTWLPNFPALNPTDVLHKEVSSIKASPHN